jgi:hypothetical protein
MDVLKNSLKKMLEALVEKDVDTATKHFNEYATVKASVLLSEDHEKYMDADELHAHLKKLMSKATEDQKEKALKHLGLKSCEDDALKGCAEKMCKKGKKHCDKVIHALEDMLAK